MCVRNAMIEDPSCSRKALRAAVKQICTQEDESARKDHLLSLPRQGELSRMAIPSTAKAWADALRSLPPEVFKFALNASHDTLPHNANLYMWKKKNTNLCPLCNEKQTLIHVLNACNTALNLRRYNERHASVLSELYSSIKSHLAPSMSVTVDLKDYNFPQHIVATNLRPDMVCWEELRRNIWFIELTVCYELCFQSAANRKEERYLDLVTSAESAGYTAQIITLEVGSRGLVNSTGFDELAKVFKIRKRDLNHLLTNLSRIAILRSHNIWCHRNK